MKLCIVGGVAGGASAAARARRLSEDAHIVLIERGPDISFANCGLPYYLGGEIADRAKLLLVTPERMRARFNLDVRTHCSVEAIDRLARTIRIRDLASGREYEETYDKLILAPGAAPLRPPIPGVDLPGIFTLRNLQDADQIKERLDQGVRQAVVVGAGFIGLEMVENLVRRGIFTTLVELQDQVLPPLDKEMTTPLAKCLAAEGVTLILGQSATGFEPTPEGLAVRLKSGQCLSAQLVVLGVGVRPENKLAVDAGLEVGPRGGIRVDEYLQTSDPNIYAVGDAIEVKDFVLGEPTQIPLAGPANRQGRIAADNIFGRAVRYRGTQGTAIVGVFGRTAAMTGASEKMLRRAHRPFRMIYIHPTHHAGYYPTLARPEGRWLLGFSKSGCGAFSLLLRNPALFGKAVAWDAPLMMERPDRYGMADIFGTQENFEKYRIVTLLKKQATGLSQSVQLIHFGYGNFREHHQLAHNLMEELKVAHQYRDGPKREHSWHSGWLPEAVEMLVEKSRNP